MLEKRLQEIIEEITTAQYLINWKFKIGDIAGGERVDLDDSSWKGTIPGYHWSPLSTISWFRKKVIIPEEICGIKTSGSRVDFALYLPVGGEVFVNEKLRAEDESWLKLDFPIARKVEPGEIFLLAIRTKRGIGYPGHFVFNLFIESVDSALFQLQLFLNEIRFIQASGRWKRKKIYQELLNKAVAEVELNLLEEKRIEEFILSLAKANKILSPFSKEMKKYTIHLVGHAHIDMNWLWDWPTTLNTIRATFKSVENFFSEYPGFIFSQSQAAVYSTTEESYPDIFQNIKRRVNEKRWDITASTWVEGDVNIVSGESLVRQILYAKKYIWERFGVDPKVCWCPDTFGHPWTYPQILKKSGIDYYYASRVGPKEWPLFWWQSPDGSRVLTFDCGITYSNKISPGLCSELIETRERVKCNHHLIVYGVGNHGGGPTRRHLEDVLKLQQEKNFPRVKFNTAEGFFQSVLKERKDLPVVNRELNPLNEGCYTTHTDIKRMNRKREALLFAAEVFSSLAFLYGKSYPEKELEKAWKNLLFNQFHDILGGCAVHSSYDASPQHATTLFEETKKLANEALDKSLQFISQQISYSKEGKPLVVFNPLSWRRQDMVEIKVKDKGIGVYDEKGSPVAFQRRNDNLFFLAEVPAVGYRTYYLREKIVEIKDVPSLSISEEKTITQEKAAYRIENRFFSARIDKQSGAITNLFDKRVNREIVSSFYQRRDEARYDMAANIFQLLYERPQEQQAGNAWIIGPISRTENLISRGKVTLIEKGPLRVVLKIEHKFSNSTLTQEMAFYAELPRIDFFTTVNWQEKGDGKNDAPMLKVAFPLEMSAGEGCFEIPFGYVHRPTNGKEVVALNWADISNKEYGVSLLNDCKYGYDIQGNTIRLTLIRSSYDPDTASDTGVNRFAYCLYPHLGDWRRGKTVQAGYGFNIPLISFYPQLPRSKQSGVVNRLPATYSFLDIQPKNLILAALKKAENNKGLVLRIYEGEGKKSSAKINLNFPVSQIRETDLMERNLLANKKGDETLLKFVPNEIKTLRLMDSRRELSNSGRYHDFV